MAETEVQLTEQEIRERAETLAREALGVSADEAWRRVKAGEFEGTLLASKLTSLHFLLGDEDLPQAAE